MLGPAPETTTSPRRAPRVALVLALAACAGSAGGSAAAQGKPKAPAPPASSAVAPPAASSAPIAPPAQPPPPPAQTAVAPPMPPMQPGAYPYGPPPAGYSPMPANEMPPGYGPPLGYYGTPVMPPGANDPAALPPPPPRARYSTPMMVSGILMTGAGIATLIAGAALVSSSRDRIDIYCDGPSLCAHKDDDALKTAGALLMAGGGVLAAAGVPLWIIGSRLVLVPKPDDKRAAGAALLRIGPASSSLFVRF